MPLPGFIRSSTLPTLSALLVALSVLPVRADGPYTPLKVKAVIVTLFEIGEDTGDRPGEYQYWVEREHLTNRVAVPGAWRPVRYRDDGVVGICTGGGIARSAASITALALDPRFDCSKAYWITAGIAGIDPADGTLGCAAWAEYIVDADLAHEIDAREMPADWPTGYVPLSQPKPYALPRKNRGVGQLMFPLNKPLVDWAYRLTRDTPLMENDVMRTNRMRYTNHPVAMGSPFVMKGDNLAGGTFWHGKLMNQWANDWVKYWTDGAGNYVTTAMEDTGTLQALTFLAEGGKADTNRVLVLRTASNFDQQPPGKTAAESLAEENGGKFSAYIPSLEAAYRVGSRVLHELLDHWSEYESKPPSGTP